jgi:hypothetical protein
MELKQLKNKNSIPLLIATGILFIWTFSSCHTPGVLTQRDQRLKRDSIVKRIDYYWNYDSSGYKTKREPCRKFLLDSPVVFHGVKKKIINRIFGKPYKSSVGSEEYRLFYGNRLDDNRKSVDDSTYYDLFRFDYLFRRVQAVHFRIEN